MLQKGGMSEKKSLWKKGSFKAIRRKCVFVN